MSGTLEGYKKARQTMIYRNFDGDEEAYLRWMRNKGSKGGKMGHTGGFADRTICEDKTCFYREKVEHHTKPQCAGARGGYVSKRTKVVK